MIFFPHLFSSWIFKLIRATTSSFFLNYIERRHWFPLSKDVLLSQSAGGGRSGRFERRKSSQPVDTVLLHLDRCSAVSSRTNAHAHVKKHSEFPSNWECLNNDVRYMREKVKNLLNMIYWDNQKRANSGEMCWRKWCGRTSSPSSRQVRTTHCSAPINTMINIF